MSKEGGQGTPRVRLTRENYGQKTAELYDGVVEWYVESYWDDETDADWIATCLEASEGKNAVVDVGSGPGNYARPFVEAGRAVACADISFEMLRAAVRRVPAVCGIVSDMRRLPFGAHSFDCVFCAYSINNIFREDLRDTMSEFERVLRPGGILCLLFKTGTLTYEFSNGGDPSSCGIMCLFSAEEMLAAIQACGIKPVLVRQKSETSEREFQHEKMLIVGAKLEG